MPYDVSAPGLARAQMDEDLTLVDTLMGGTHDMRARRERYLPREEKESEHKYEGRLKRTFLFNAFKETVIDLTSRPFSKPVALSDKSDAALAALQDNVDNAGRNLHNFARDFFQCGLSDGLVHVFVDYPRAPAGMTLADELSSGYRPYFAEVKAADLIYFESGRVNGTEKLTKIRFNEWTVDREANGGQRRCRRIREVELGADGVVRWTLYGETPPAEAAKSPGSAGWYVVDGPGEMTIGEIPLVTFYTNREGFQLASPPLLPLAEMNLQHWQETSDQNNILHVARVPILFGAGFQENELSGAVIGASEALRSLDPNAKLSYVEHTGAAIGAGRTSIMDLENRMRVAGVDLLVRRAGDETATAKAIDASGKMMNLHAMARACEMALEDAFALAAEWMGLPEGAGVDVVINQDFGLSLRDAENVKILYQSVAIGKISNETYIDELKRHGVVSDDLVVEDELARIEAQGPSLGAITRPPGFGGGAAG